MGFDSLWVGYWRFKIRNHAEIEDMFGRVFDLVDDGYGNVYFMYREGLINSPEEWRRWPRPDIAGYALAGLRIFKVLDAIWRKKIALIPFVGPGLWENSWQPMGLPRFVSLMKRDPAFAREVIGYFTTLSVACIDAYGKAGARIMSYGDDLAYKAGPMLSPEMFEEFYGNGYRQITATAHRYGARIFIHCCGNTNELVEKFVEWGFDGAHAFEPTAMNDLAETRRKVGDRLCLIGNIDVTHTLVDDTREEVEQAVRKAIEDSAGGGFILAPTHSHASISVENIRWMIEAGHHYSA
jgi:uroporphyrinogen decarboxylase